MTRTKIKPNKIYQKKLKIHKLAHEIATTKDELKKRKLRTQLKRQLTSLKMMALPSKAQATI
jgi:hypothetical protein